MSDLRQAALEAHGRAGGEAAGAGGVTDSPTPTIALAVGSRFERGVRPRVLVMGTDFKRGESVVRVLMRALEDGGIEVLDAWEIKIEVPPPMPECVVLAAPKNEPLTYGPQRKGRGGKVRRW